MCVPSPDWTMIIYGYYRKPLRKYTPWAMHLHVSGSSKRRWRFFFKYIVCSLYFIHRNSTTSLLSCACLYNNSKWYLSSFVSPSSCTVLLLWCFLLNITTCTVVCINRWGCAFERKSLCATTSFKGCGPIFENRPIFEIIAHVLENNDD